MTCDINETTSTASEALVQRLLGLGGLRVVLQAEPDGFMPTIIERGRVFPGKGTKKIAGTRSSCHRNAAIRYLQFLNGQTKYQSCDVVTGYGLSEGDLWRQHTWLLVEDRVIETTVRRLLYFGVVLNPAEAARFVLGEVTSLLPDWQQRHRDLVA